MKQLMLPFLLILGLTTQAQDTLYFMKRAPQVVKVLEINPGKIRYKPWDYQDGPEYVAGRREVMKIASANGRVIWVNDDAWHKDIDMQKREEGRKIRAARGHMQNVLYCSPFAIQSNGVGVNLAYEHISADGIWGFKFPVIATISTPGVYLAPAIRIYPFGQRFGTFYLAPAVYGGYGQRFMTFDAKDKYGYDSTYRAKRHNAQAGFFLEVGVNFRLTPNTCFSVCAGGGLNYLDLDKDLAGYNAPFGKFEVGFGYMFNRNKKAQQAAE